ncbi:MAG TPA: exodeoxyribonuclease VII large subunit, partial [Treponemataceae bacterium]|nr:exodeoxyribonuclease VII large subunit [Treponemataceae bacterium]
MNGERPVKISEITAIIKEILEGSFPSVLLEGEISNYRPSSTGHLYFTLKDDSSSISAVMFKGRSRQLAFVPRDGMLVRAKGSISVYEARGTYQIIIDSMEQAGTGDILRLLEERKQRLAREGLFDEKRKRPIPFFPERIAVITSPTGAAVRDIVQILRRRNPAIHIVILPASVQGSEAPESLARQIETANRFAMADLIIIGRGGGSLEDLLPFSDESVVRSIAASKIPVISAVGHETDWSLSDLAADVRAPTPSAAAELASPLAEDILDTIRTSISLLEQS